MRVMTDDDACAAVNDLMGEIYLTFGRIIKILFSPM